jgi:hypothetical protein
MQKKIVDYESDNDGIVLNNTYLNSKIGQVINNTIQNKPDRYLRKSSVRAGSAGPHKGRRLSINPAPD